MRDHMDEQRRLHRLAVGQKGEVPADLQRSRASREEKRLAIIQQELLT
jgi:hypothetical protein